MAKIERIAPKEQNTIRVSLGVSYNDILKVFHFKPKALEVREEAGTSADFQLTLASGNSMGRKGLSIGIPTDKDAKVAFIANFDKQTPEESILATCANALGHLKTIEAQMKTALEELAKAEETIKEV